MQVMGHFLHMLLWASDVVREAVGSLLDDPDPYFSHPFNPVSPFCLFT